VTVLHENSAYKMHTWSRFSNTYFIDFNRGTLNLINGIETSCNYFANGLI